MRVSRRGVLSSAAAVACLSASGCAYKPLAGSSIGYKISPGLHKEAAAAGEANLYVQGWLRRDNQAALDNVFVLATSLVAKEAQTVVVMPVASHGYFQMFLPDASYRLSAYVDKNADGQLSYEECVGSHPHLLTLAQDGPSSHFDVDIDVGETTSCEKAHQLGKPVLVGELASPEFNAGEDLAAPRYAPEVGTLGLINPNTFLQEFSTLQYLEEPDFTDDRIPVIMVHGIDGTPAVFDRLESKLRRARFQAWFFYFPSGARLPSTAEMLQKLFLSGSVVPPMKTAVLTAHSMGGLVTRGAINLQDKDSTPIALYTSFVTPYGGVKSANVGILTSPFRVPSWVDVASGSDYQKSLFPALPQSTHFHLIAGNSEGDSDGTISLDSQKFPLAVAQATEVSVFPQSHVGIMSDEAALDAYFSRLGPVFSGRKAQAPISENERISRAHQSYSMLLTRLLEAGFDVRFSDVTKTSRRWFVRHGHEQLSFHLSVGRGLRASFLGASRSELRRPWQEEPSQPAPLAHDEAIVRPALAAFVDELMRSLDSRMGEPASAAQTRVPAPLPLAPHEKKHTPPPVHLFLGLMGTLNLGAQDFTLRVPGEFAMYFGNIGFGLDARLPLYSPRTKRSEADLLFNPFGLGTGPRLRLGNKNSLLAVSLGANIAAEFGTVRVVMPDADRQTDEADTINEEFVAAAGAYGSAHLGVRLAPDFYVRAGADLGSLFSPIAVEVLGEEDRVKLLTPPFFNVLLGLEVRIP